MRNTTLLIAALAAVTATAAVATPSPPAPAPRAAQPFMGTIDIKVIAPEDSGGIARFHMSEAGVATEVDLGAAVGAGPAAQRLRTRTLTKKNATSFWIIDDKTKSYREIALQALRDSQRRPASETWHVQNVGKATVAGFPAQHVVAVSSKGMRLELWTTTAIGTDDAFHAAFVDQAKLSTSLMDALERNGAGGIPAKVLTKTPQGEMGIEIVAVKKGAPAKGLFEVPASYVRLDDPVMPPGAQRAPQKPSRNVEGKLSL